MTLEIFWSERAQNDLDQIFGYVGQFNERAALIDRIEQSVASVATFPEMFPRGRIDGTREIVAHPNYIVVYQIGQSGIEVLGVVHTSRDYPRTTHR